MIKAILNLFRCSHTNMSWPITVRKKELRITYQVCFDCGKELKYDFNKMKYTQFTKTEKQALISPNYGQGAIQE